MSEPNHSPGTAAEETGNGNGKTITLTRTSFIWLVGTVAASLLVTVFIGGLVLGRAVSPGGPPSMGQMGEMTRPSPDGQPGPGARGDFDLRRLVVQLPPRDRQLMVRTFRQIQEGVRAERGGMEDAARALRDSLLAEDFDPDAFEAAFDRFGGHSEAIRQTTKRIILDTIEEMSPQGRAVLGRVVMTQLAGQSRPIGGAPRRDDR